MKNDKRMCDSVSERTKKDDDDIDKETKFLNIIEKEKDKCDISSFVRHRQAIIMFLGKYFKAYLVGGFSAIGGFLFGYHTGVISGVLTMDDFKTRARGYNFSCTNDTIECVDNLPGALTGYIVGILLLGCFLGSLLGGQTSDRFSRKYSISAFSVIFTIGAAIQTASINLAMILIGRFFAGKSTI